MTQTTPTEQPEKSKKHTGVLCCLIAQWMDSPFAQQDTPDKRMMENALIAISQSILEGKVDFETASSLQEYLQEARDR